MFKKASIALAGICLLAACGSDQAPSPAADTTRSATTSTTADFASQAAEIARNSIIIDTHIDVPYRIYPGWEDVSVATEGGDFDYPRAVAGGLNAPFMSIYTPASLEAEGQSKQVAEELIDLVNRIADEAPDKFAVALSPDDVEEHFAQGLISLPMGSSTFAITTGTVC